MFIEQFPIKRDLLVCPFNLAPQEIVSSMVKRLPGQLQITFHLPKCIYRLPHPEKYPKLMKHTIAGNSRRFAATDVFS